MKRPQLGWETTFVILTVLLLVAMLAFRSSDSRVMHDNAPYRRSPVVVICAKCMHAMGIRTPESEKILSEERIRYMLDQIRHRINPS